MISSKAVYVDAAGGHSNSESAPRFDGPIRETQPTVAPGADDHETREGYEASKVAAENVLLESGEPITVVRPSKLHGVGAWRPREWFFVRRASTGAPLVVLARRGSDIDHTTAAANIATLVEVVAVKPARILNSADPDAPSVLEISRTIARLLGHRREEVLLEDVESSGDIGRHPWDAEHPIVLDATAATELGYVPDRRLRRNGRRGDGAGSCRPYGDGSLRPDDEFFAGSFDNPAEDAFLVGPAAECLGLHGLPEYGRAAGAAVGVERVVRDHADPRPTEPRVEALGVVPGDRVEHEERLALCARLLLGALHQELRDTAPTGRSVDEELRDVGSMRLVRRSREDDLHRADDVVVQERGE